jgi:hypothetical protein
MNEENNEFYLFGVQTFRFATPNMSKPKGLHSIPNFIR